MLHVPRREVHLRHAAQPYAGGGAEREPSTLNPTGEPRSKEIATPYDPTVGLCPGPYGGLRGGGAVSYEQGTPCTPSTYILKPEP